MKHHADHGTLVADPGRFDLRLLRFERMRLDDQWCYRRVRSPFWRWYVNDGAGAAIRWDGGEHRLVPGLAHLIPAWLTFDCLPPRAPIEHLYAHVEVPFLPAVLVRRQCDRPLAVPLGQEGLRQVHHLIEGPPGPAQVCRLKALVLAALASVLDDLPALTADLDHLAEDPIDPALRDIDDRLADELSVTGLAARCGLTTDAFIRRFRTRTGQTPGQYLIERRIAAAAARLLATRETVEEVAAACGFHDRAYFSRAFTRRLGVPPGRYRHAAP